MKKLVFILTFSLLVTFSLKACQSIDAELDTAGPIPAETVTPIPEPTPRPSAADAQWPNWIYDVNPDTPHWWTMPGWGISTTIDWDFQQLGLYFRAPREQLGVAQKMAITQYLRFIASEWNYYYIFPLVAAAAAGDSQSQENIVSAIANRIIALRDGGFDIYHTYIALLSNRDLVYDEITRDIFEKIQHLSWQV